MILKRQDNWIVRGLERALSDCLDDIFEWYLRADGVSMRNHGLVIVARPTVEFDTSAAGQ